MKKVILFISSVVLLIGFANPQSAIAQNKIKKVKYMNHKYKGEVNRDKIPDGEGELDLLGIKGFFEGNNVTNATIDGGKVKYYGDLTFDESYNVTLKAGGTFIYYYCVDSNYHSWQRQADKGYGDSKVEEVLQSDKVVSADEFNITEKEIEIPIHLKGVENKLNPPVFPKKFLLKEHKYEYTEKETYMGQQMQFQRNRYVFVLDNNDQSLNIHGVKDEQGRVWNYIRRNNSYSYKVTYPDGSYYSHSEEPGKRDTHWMVCLPNNVTIEGGQNHVLITTKDNIVRINGGVFEAGIDGFIALNESKSVPKVRSLEVKFLNKDAQNIPDNEVEKLIKEEIIPVYGATNVDVMPDLAMDGYTESLGSFRDGQYISKKTMTAKAWDKEKAREKAARPYLNKKYGKAYVDAIANGKLSVGMPLNLLIDSELAYVRQGVTVYKMHVYNDGERGDFKVEIAVAGKTHTGGPGIYYRMYRIWVNNRKITQFREWTNADDREFSLIHR